MDWDNMNRGRRLKIQDEYTSKIKAYSRCYGNINKFLDKLCKSFQSKITKKTIENIKNKDEVMGVFREETQIPIVLFKIRKEEKKAEKSNL